MNKIILSFIVLIYFSITVTAQSKFEKKANRAYENFLYKRAIMLYEKEKEPSSDALRNLADCYIKTQQYSNLEGVFQTLVTTLPYNSEDYWNYAEAVKYNQKYEKYDTIIRSYFESYKNSERTKQLKSEAESFNQILNSEPRFNIYPSNVNTPEQEFSLNYFGDSVIFIGTGSNQTLTKEVWSVNQKPFLDLFVGIASDSGKIINIQSFDSKIEANYHYGPVSFNKDFSKMIFTRNDAETSKDGVIRLQLYSSDFNGKDWSKEIPLIINSPEYSVGHPAIDSKNKRLFFASDMPGGFGGTDIYYCNYNDKWELSTPINLGPKVNTPSNELFPFYHQKGYLMFSSNGHLSLGGLDNYLAKFDTLEKEILFIQNLGKPINSNYDDFSLVMDYEMEKGYFSSDRVGGKGSDDIYYFFTKDQTLQQPYLIHLIVTLPNGDTANDYSFNLLNNTELLKQNYQVADTIPYLEVFPGMFKINIEKAGFLNDSLKLSILENTFLYNAHIKLQKIEYPEVSFSAKDAETNQEINDVFFTAFVVNMPNDSINKKGSFKYTFDDFFDSTLVFLSAEATGYQKGELTKKIYSREGLNQSLTIQLFKEQMPIKNESVNTNQTVAIVEESVKNNPNEVYVSKNDTTIELDHIYFDFDEDVITENSKIVLDSYINLLKQNSNWRIEVKSYTDCQGSDEYNLMLSNNRAKETVEYIQSHIQNKDRAFGKGYGESNPKINCNCDDPKPICTIAQQKMNRRSEFYIIK